MTAEHDSLLAKLDQIDNDLLNLWVEDEGEMSDAEKWSVFVMLLERRVDVLKVIRDAKISLPEERCLPKWLERLTQSRQELRLREIKMLYDEVKRQKKVASYEEVGRLRGDDTI